jgi:DNA-binding protein HU-beta
VAKAAVQDDVDNDTEGTGGKAVKQDLIKIVANETGLSEAQAGKAVNAFLMAIHDHLARNVEVQISGFGSFKVVERAAREGRNPRTGETMTIEARRSPTFKPGTQLKRTVEEGA